MEIKELHNAITCYRIYLNNTVVPCALKVLVDDNLCLSYVCNNCFICKVQDRKGLVSRWK